MDMMNCPSMAVSMDVMHHVVTVESSYNPYAIGVVGGRLVRQPKNLPEALATVRMLEERGYNFSLGLAQVNRYNLAKYGLDYAKAFQVCPNLQAGSRILAECYNRSRDWGKSFSCYYSGNFTTGFQHGYVQKVYASIRKGYQQRAADPYGVPAIALAGERARPQAQAATVTRRIISDAPVAQAQQMPQAALAAAPQNAANAASGGLSQADLMAAMVQPSPTAIPAPQAAQSEVVRLADLQPGAKPAASQVSGVDNAFVF
nr:lytic transglycosylase domain-containing protein [Luteimonas aquatica]